jgi:hypothetical protein
MGPYLSLDIFFITFISELRSVPVHVYWTKIIQNYMVFSIILLRTPQGSPLLISQILTLP